MGNSAQVNRLRQIRWDLFTCAATHQNGTIFRAQLHPESGVTYEADPEFLEHARREDTSGGEQPNLPWDA